MNNETEVYPKLFTWLSIGLLISFITGYGLSMSPEIMMNVLSIGIFPIIIIELGIALVMGLRISKMQPITAKICYIIYCFTTGLTLSVIFIAYQMSSIIMIFAIAALIFALMAIYGYTTKSDLSRIGTILFFGLLGIIVCSLLNIFTFKSSSLELGIAVLSILVFVGYIAYDMKRVKYMLATVGEEKAAVYGAFQLYLDFINLFIRLLQIFGKRND